VTSLHDRSSTDNFLVYEQSFESEDSPQRAVATLGDENPLMHLEMPKPVLKQEFGEGDPG
jgi:hypothetical protein